MFILKCYKGEFKVEGIHVRAIYHKDVGRTIEEHQRKGWRFYTHQTAGIGSGPIAYNVNFYLLFDKGK